MNIFTEIALNGGGSLVLRIDGQLVLRGFQPSQNDIEMPEEISVISGHRIPELIAALRILHELSLKQSIKKQQPHEHWADYWEKSDPQV